MSELQTVRVVVFSKEQYDGEWPPTTLAEAILWFQEKLDSIPEEYRAGAEIEFGSAGGYEGSHYAEIAIYYWRPETPKERDIRDTQAEVERQQEIKRNLGRLTQLGWKPSK